MQCYLVLVILKCCLYAPSLCRPSITLLSSAAKYRSLALPQLTRRRSQHCGQGHFNLHTCTLFYEATKRLQIVQKCMHRSSCRLHLLLCIVLAHAPHRVEIGATAHFFGIARAAYVAQRVRACLALGPVAVATETTGATHLDAKVLELLAHCVAPFNSACPRLLPGSVAAMPRNDMWQVAALLASVVVEAALVVDRWHWWPRRW